MRGVIYARFSSSGQREESIDAQVRFCREYAARHKIDIIRVYKDEAISGKESATKKRRDYQRLMRDALAGGFDVILVHKYDRIARSVMEHFSIAAKLAPLKVDLIAVSQEFDNSPEGKMMKVIMWAYSEYYIDNLAAEVKKGHRENALKAVWNGGVAPFGYDVVNKQLVINPAEAVYVRRLFDAVLAGERYTDILEEMRKAGIRGKRGREIKYTQVYEMLRNEKYTGVYTYTLTEETRREDRRVKPNAIRVNDAFPAIISREEFEKVQNILRSRRRSGRPMERREYLLSGYLYCGCGARMYGHTSTAKRNNKTYVNSFYACKDKCGNKSIKVEYIENVVMKYLADLISPQRKKALLEGVEKYIKSTGSREDVDRAALRIAVAEREKELDALVGNLSKGDLPEIAVNRIGQEIEQRQRDIDTLKSELAAPTKKVNTTLAEYLDYASDNPRENIQHYIKKVIVKCDAIEIITTFEDVALITGCGGSIDLINTILLGIKIPRLC